MAYHSDRNIVLFPLRKIVDDLKDANGYIGTQSEKMKLWLMNASKRNALPIYSSRRAASDIAEI